MREMMSLFCLSVFDLSSLDCFISPIMSCIFSLNCVDEVAFLLLSVAFHFLIVRSTVVGCWVTVTTCIALVFCDGMFDTLPPPPHPPPPAPAVEPTDTGADITMGATGDPTAKSEK